MSLTDELREEMIRTTLQASIDALERGLKDSARAHFATARELIAGRRKLMVQRLERERGLWGA